MRRVCFAGLAVCMLVSSVFAIDWDSFLTENGLEIIQKTGDDNYLLQAVIGRSDVQIDLRIDNLDYDPYLLQILAVVDYLNDFEQIVLKKIEMVLQNSKLVTYIIPETIPSRSGNASLYVPSGIRLYYEEKLEYDFYLLINNMVINLKGQFFNEKHLLERINDALADPLLYVSSQEPDFLRKRIETLEEGIFAIQEEGMPQLQAAVEKMSVDIQNSIEALSMELDTFRKGNVRLLAQSDVSDEVIREILKAYRETPDASSSVLRKTLQAQGYRVKTKVLRAVIAAYKGRFVK